MVCLREINGFLNRLLHILPLVTFAPNHHFWGLDRNSFQKLQKRRQRVVMKSSKCFMDAWVQIPAPPLKQLSSVTSPSLRVPIYEARIKVNQPARTVIRNKHATIDRTFINCLAHSACPVNIYFTVSTAGRPRALLVGSCHVHSSLSMSQSVSHLLFMGHPLCACPVLSIQQWSIISISLNSYAQPCWFCLWNIFHGFLNPARRWGRCPRVHSAHLPIKPPCCQCHQKKTLPTWNLHWLSTARNSKSKLLAETFGALVSQPWLCLQLHLLAFPPQPLVLVILTYVPSPSMSDPPWLFICT